MCTFLCWSMQKNRQTRLQCVHGMEILHTMNSTFLALGLARHLVRAEIKPETMVPVCFQKSVYAIIAMVAIHRAGGAFVPLDPSHPDDHLKAIIQRTNAKLIVASTETSH